MSIYLYGASVQGIQGFIFETNKLKEIVGASELVEEICTNLFVKFINEKNVTKILMAAGNIRLSAIDKTDLERLVLEFPKEVQSFAPGITISQALVKSKGDDIVREDFELLEKRLQIQRNIVSKPLEITGCAIRRSGRTGKSAVSYDKFDNKSLIDFGTKQKSEQTIDLITKKLITDNKGFNINGETYGFPRDMSNITHSECKWLAVIHADGNNLGKRIRELLENKSQPQLETYRQFSSDLEQATCEAAKTTFDHVIREKIRLNEIKTNKGSFPVRPIVLGGDDFTLICRADLAIEFASTYLNEFEFQTEKAFAGKKMTACAGISFVKESYPFHYAIHLAEELCAVSKTKSKTACKNQGLKEVHSSLAFHKVHSSYIDSYNEIKENSLYAKESDVRFDYGPYTINNDIEVMPPLSELVEKIKEFEKMKQENNPSPKSGLRRWLSELSHNKESANQLLERLNIIHKKQMVELGLVNPINQFKETIVSDHKEQMIELGSTNPINETEKDIFYEKTIVYDLLSILSLKGGE